MNKQFNLEKKFNEFIESGALDKEEADFCEYETCIVEFDNKIK